MDGQRKRLRRCHASLFCDRSRSVKGFGAGIFTRKTRNLRDGTNVFKTFTATISIEMSIERT